MVSTKNIIQAGALVIVLAVIFALASYLRTENYSDEDKGPRVARLELEAAQLNATLPEMVSEGVRLDKATAGPGNLFNYFYTIIDDEAARNLKGNSKKLKELKMQLLERVCSTMPERRTNRTIVNYAFKNNAGATLTEIAINPADC
jgi:hypothetical protein